MASSDPWPSDDPLGEALYLLRMRGAFYCRSELTAPWGLTLPPMPPYLWFHAVTAGRGWLEVEGEEPRRLETGDLALVLRGEGHRLRSEPGAAAPRIHELEPERVGPRYEILRHGAGGAPTEMMCCAVAFDHPAARSLVGIFPKVIHLAALGRLDRMEWLESTLRLMAAEVASRRPGGEAVITRLADILVVQTIRTWITEAPAARAGWVGALRDPQIGRAMLLIHREPARDWTVESLAAEAGMSRSAFAQRFKSLLGDTPLAYVTRWRMMVAASWLEQGDVPLGEIARRLGYQSKAAFSRAFKRTLGQPPGAVRRGLNAAAELPPRG